MNHTAFDRIYRHIRDFGLRGLHLRLLAGFSIYREIPIYDCDFSMAAQIAQPADPITISILSPDELNEYLSIDTESHSDPSILWDRGATCFLARHDNQIVASVWVAERSFLLSYVHDVLHLDPHEIYMLEAFTQPPFRGKRLLPAMIDYIFDYYRSRGRHHAYTIINSYNKSSIRCFHRSGFNAFKLGGFWQFGPWRKSFARPLT